LSLLYRFKSYHGNFGKDYLHNQRLTGGKLALAWWTANDARAERASRGTSFISARYQSSWETGIKPSLNPQRLVAAETLTMNLFQIMKGSAGFY